MKAQMTEIHYDGAGKGATITIHRRSNNPKYTYKGRVYKYTEKRAARVILATPSPAWITHQFYYPPSQLTTRVP
jgi:hypothetical protein